MGILSVCLTVTTRYGFKPEIETPGLQSSPYDSLESLVSNEVILVPLDEEIPLWSHSTYLRYTNSIITIIIIIINEGIK